MLKKTLETLKRNPVIIIMFFLMVIVLAFPLIFLLPDLNKLISISDEISKNAYNTNAMDTQKIFEILVITLKLILYALFSFAVGVVAISGLGNLISEAVNEGKTSFRVFFTGIKKYFVKTLLFLLLLTAFSFGFGAVISMVSIPFTVLSMLSKGIEYQSISNNQMVIQAFSTILVIFAYPLVELWIPAIYLNKNDGIIVCLKNGFKAGIKNYKLLVVLTAVIYLPSVVLLAVSKNLYSVNLSPANIAIYAYQVIVAPVVFVYFFILYNRIKLQSLNKIGN